tara:strand:+ start:159 stop:653 length:495 start_codon:yes stop_codon:yes gene_type:complete
MSKVRGFTCGAFDLLHAGHALMLKEAKESCDHLIVGVQGDPSIDRPGKNKPVQSYEERVTMVKAIRWVDEVVLYNTEEELYKLLEDIKPEVRIIGADWKGKPFTGFNLPIKVVFNSRDHGYSSSELRSRVMNAEIQKKVHSKLAPHMDKVAEVLEELGLNEQKS